MKINRVDGVRQRISLATGKVIKKPLESKQRSHPITASIGPKDTAPNDVYLLIYLNPRWLKWHTSQKLSWGHLMQSFPSWSDLVRVFVINNKIYNILVFHSSLASSLGEYSHKWRMTSIPRILLHITRQRYGACFLGTLFNQYLQSSWSW